MTISRRDTLKLGALGALGAAGLAAPLGTSVLAKSISKLPAAQLPRPYTTAFAKPPVLACSTPGTTNPAFGSRYYEGETRTHDFYRITQRQSTARILPNVDTPVYAYNGSVPGPTIKSRTGTPTLVHMHNNLPAVHPYGHPFHTSTHLHGSASLPQYDGYASDVTYPGTYKRYEYPNTQNARTLWYHDHGVHNTAKNAYTGLAAQYHLHDEMEEALLPQDEFDVPITVTDAMFAADGKLQFDDSSHTGLWGDVILVNGRAWPYMEVKRRIYRFRFLVASISRSYRFALSTGDGCTVVATDGGLMPKAMPVSSWRQGPAERYEVLIDFSRYKAGQVIELKNLSNPNNVDYDNTGKVMQFRVVDAPFDTRNNTMPTVLNPGHVAMNLDLTQVKAQHTLRVERSNGLWAINGKSWADVIASKYTAIEANPDVGDIEVWTIENRSGGWFHPVHIHLIDFQVLDRNGKPPFDWERGPKDVVYVGENETVRVAMKFEPHQGRYMVHCHNLPHEDHDMMVQFRVGRDDVSNMANDPIEADKCQPDVSND